jgi:hypothetical protein
MGSRKEPPSGIRKIDGLRVSTIRVLKLTTLEIMETKIMMLGDTTD